MGCEAYKTNLQYELRIKYECGVTIRILAQNFMLLLKHFIIKVLEYKAEELICMHCYVFLSDESLFT